MAQEKKADDAKSQVHEVRTVEGTVKSAQADGIVTSGKDQAKVGSKEPEHDGKVIAQRDG